MKLTRSQLKQTIKEALEKVLNEQDDWSVRGFTSREAKRWQDAEYSAEKYPGETPESFEKMKAWMIKRHTRKSTPKTPEDKLVNLFPHNPRQAIELGHSMGNEVNKDLLTLLEGVLSAFHDFMRMYAWLTPDSAMREEDVPLSVQPHNEASDINAALHQALDKSIYALEKKFGPSGYEGSPGTFPVGGKEEGNFDAQQTDAYDEIGERANELGYGIWEAIKDRRDVTLEDPAYVTAKEWAGEPRG